MRIAYLARAAWGGKRTSREYTYPFGKQSGMLSSSIIFPLMRHTIVELTWWLQGTS